VSDLYSAKPVFAWGFLGLGITNLIISFMTNQYAYYVFRAISGIFGAATVSPLTSFLGSIDRGDGADALDPFGVPIDSGDFRTGRVASRSDPVWA